MKSKLFKVVVVLMLLATLTLTNFVYVGAGVISYAASKTETNHKNVEFTAELKDASTLTLSVNVKNEGYFNGKITIDNSNFKLKSSESEYVNKVEENKITLNQINAGSNAQFDVVIEPIKDDSFDVDLLTKETSVNLSGIYKDRTEKDIKIKASRDVKLDYTYNKEDNVANDIELVTNKVVNINNEEKRIIQLSLNMGLKSNEYPIKEINEKVILPDLGDKIPEVVAKSNLNTMTKFDYKFDKKSTIELSFTNEPNTENKINWQKQGTENVILTLIYGSDVNLDDNKIATSENVKLYDDNELASENAIIISEDVKDDIIQLTSSNAEDTIYKGRLNANLPRGYYTTTTVSVNLANIGTGINIKENAVEQADVIYNKTYISKADFDKILGNDGTIVITDQKGTTITTLTSSSNVDENGNLVVDYGDNKVTSINIKTTKPVAEGNLVINHSKTILPDVSVTNVDSLTTIIEANYGTDETISVENNITLANSTTLTELQANKESLSTVITNNVEIRATLKSNNENENLFANPQIQIELPDSVEGANITGIDLIYESEMKIKDYYVSGKTIYVSLEGKQTSYKPQDIEGAIVIINADLTLNRRAATHDSSIIMSLNNNGEVSTNEVPIKVVAPTDMTVIQNIEDLGIETIGQEESEETSLARGAESKELNTNIEIINNNENAMQNVKIVGTFPTKDQNNNNIAASITEGINLTGVEDAKVYYTENENATDDIQDANNGWQETITNGENVKKYLVEVPRMETGASVAGTYKTTIPSSLEYNQQASQGYEVNYENTVTGTESNLKATTINLATGVGPKLETNISATLNGNKLTDTSKVKNGEVIKYKIEVSNVGSEDVSNVNVTGTIPDGTILVQPEDNYEYSGPSYYKELDDKTYTATIDSLKKGEVVTKEYEVRVKSDAMVGSKISAVGSIKYGDVTKDSTSPAITVESGDLRVTVKRVTDRSIDLYEYGSVEYFAIIENISSKKQDNVVVTSNIPKSLTVSNVRLLTNVPVKDEAQAEDVSTEVIDYKDNLDIGSIEPGKNKILAYSLTINKLEDANNINFSVKANSNNVTYNSNNIVDNVIKASVSMRMEADPEGQYLKSGDKLTYKIWVKNTGTQRIDGLSVNDELPSSLTVDNVITDGTEDKSQNEYSKVSTMIDLEAGEEKEIDIETLVNYSSSRTQPEVISNVAYAESMGNRIATTQEISHIIEASSSTNNNNNNENNNDIANGSSIITGMAWVDEDGNGQKDDSENYLSGIKVNLYNTETGNLVKDSKGNPVEVETNDKGLYALGNIANGKYIVVFNYNTDEYGLAKYKASGTSESNNSSAILKKLTIDGSEKEIASTDIIEINDNNVGNVNIGLIKLQNFSFKLDKFVNKIVLQDSKGSTVKEYGDETLARAEIDGKKVNGTTVLIEYKIRVTNIGEVDGYVRKIADYAPTDLKFNSELNKDWYQTSDGIYSTSLASTKLSAGQSAELTLVLTKTMTENNLGLINNTAEITDIYNVLGLTDKNATAGNKVQGEQDTGAADLILGVKTGGATYVGITIAIIAALGAIVFIILRIKKDKKEITDIDNVNL